jgi:hypothetical protein
MRSLHRLIAHQLGTVSRAQARAARLSEHRVDGLIARGEWVRVHAGVYRLAGAPQTHDQRVMAALLAAGDGSAASHRTAGVTHGTRQFTADLVEISVPSYRRPRLEGVVVHRVGRMGEGDLMKVGPLTVTRPPRTFLDLAGLLPLGICTRLLEEWLADRLLTVAQLRRCLEEHAGRGRKGLAAARRALDERVLGDERADSTDEHLLPTLLREYGAPLPVHHHLIRADDGRVLMEPDYAYVPERLAILVHGYHVKTRQRRHFEDLLAEANALLDLDWELRQYTPHQLRQAPWRVCAEIETARVRRARQLGQASERTI